MKKYLKIFTTGLQNDLVYRINFVTWRIRQVVQFLIPYFVWTTLVKEGELLYGYSLPMLLTYVLASRLVLGALVFGSRTIDLAGIINNGDLTLYLMKPVSIFKYWFTRDLSDKLINLSFIFVEVPILIYLLKPPLFLQGSAETVVQFILATSLAVLMYFFLNFLFGTVGFWTRDVWAPRFLLFVVIEFASGGFFPLDMLPQAAQNILNITPFPYMLFFPLQTYLGNSPNFWQQFMIASVWTVLLYLATRLAWKRGLLNYDAEGR